MKKTTLIVFTFLILTNFLFWGVIYPAFDQLGM
jgi:hypothetical protein